MRQSESRCIAFLLTAWATVPAMAAGAVSVTFDDIDASQADIPIVSPYQGLAWSNFTAYTAVPGFEGFNNGIVSGQNAAYGGGEAAGPDVAPLVSSITALPGQSFNFMSAAFGAGYYDGLSLLVTGTSHGAVVGTRTLTLSTSGAVPSTFSFLGLDTLTFTATRAASSTDPFACGFFDCTQFTLDDLSLVISDRPVTSTVPESGSAALLVVGLAFMIGLGTMRRRPSLPAST